MSFQYDVFFSYRHKPLDAELTQKVFNLVESYRLPRALRAKGCEEIRRAFRDTEELPVSRILTDTIDRALRSTKCLIVVCSTDTPSSEWIDREVATFIELGRPEHIYPLLISGDPEHSFPPSLKLVPDIEPRIMDIRTPGSSVKAMMAKAETEVLRVIADVAGCTETELVREHKLRRNRRFALRSLASLAAFAAFAGISLGLMGLAQDYRDTAQKREAASMRILSELTYSLPDRLTNVPGAYGRIAGILERNTEDINAIVRLSSDKAGAENEAAANYEKLANASAVLGRYEEALAAQDRAIAVYAGLETQGAEGGAEKLASSYNNRGNLLHAAGRYKEADAAYAEAIALLESADGGRLLPAQIYLNAGANAVSFGREDDAAKYFEKSIALLSDAETSEEAEAAVKVRYNYGVLLYREGDYPGAEEQLRAACALGERLLADADSLQNRALYVRSVSTLASVLTDTGSFEEADRCYELAIKGAEELAEDGENTDYQRNLAELVNNRALNYNIRGDYERADGLYARAADLYAALAQKTAAPSDRAVSALTLLNLGENAFKLSDYPRSRSYFEQGLRTYEGALDELGEYDRAQYLAWLSYYRLIHLRDCGGALDAALEAYGLQPNNVLVTLNLGYACLYGGYDDDADLLLNAVAALGAGQAETIRRDLAAQAQAGMVPGHRVVLP